MRQARQGGATSTLMEVKDIRIKPQVEAAIALPDGVVVQGELEQQVFFLAAGGPVQHRAERLPFSALVGLPGATPGMDVQATPRVEEVLWTVSPEGPQGKVLLSLAVKVVERVAAPLAEGPGPELALPAVLGEGSAQLLLEGAVPLPAALSVERIAAAVGPVTVEPLPGRALVQGTVRHQIYYLAGDGTGRHRAEDLPFSTVVAVPGLLPGLAVQVQAAVEAVLPALEPAGFLRWKSVLSLQLRALARERRTVPTGGEVLYRVLQVEGEGGGQFLEEAELALPLPALQVRDGNLEVRLRGVEAFPDGALVQGLLTGQVFYVGEDGVEHHYAFTLPFTGHLALPGASPETRVEVSPRLEFVAWELPAPQKVRLRAMFSLAALALLPVQLPLLPGPGPLFQLERVVGEQVVQFWVEGPPLPPPPPQPVVLFLLLEDPVLIGEGSRQIIVEERAALPSPAASLLEVRGEVRELEAVSLTETALLEGFVHKQIAFVDPEGLVREAAEEVPFAILVSVPGAREGMGVQAGVRLEEINFNLLPGGREVDQVLVLEGTARVTAVRRLSVV
ncbi:MAG: DUF3794 domain-containing protein, partial [Bacillota bacterium]|nr:DUF3794 domain-containing protein [Bacillota bacterium]